jgi:flagellar biosynthesis/type III secretory pathway protein FliH
LENNAYKISRVGTIKMLPDSVRARHILISAQNNNYMQIADSLMKSNECLIETDFGVFDSSLDVQLSNLAKDIKLLACAMGSN